jgi:hypothetical protein
LDGVLLLPHTCLHFFVLTQKNEAKKSQDCARFARKIYAQTAKSSKLARSSLRQGRFLTLFSLISWLTGRGPVSLQRIEILQINQLRLIKYFCHVLSKLALY